MKGISNMNSYHSLQPYESNQQLHEQSDDKSSSWSKILRLEVLEN